MPESRARLPLLWPIDAGLLIAPLLVLGVQAIVAEPKPLEVFAGAVTATLFFAVTAVAGRWTGDGKALYRAVLLSYAAKVVLLAIVAWLVVRSDLDATAFAVSVAASATLYLTVYLTLLSRAPRDPM